MQSVSDFRGVPQQMRFTKRQIRHFKREAKARAYRSGTGINADADQLAGASGARFQAALAKRERKAEKRAYDAEQSAVGQMISREVLEGSTLRGQWLAGTAEWPVSA